MTTLEKMIEALKNYQGNPIKIMEVCGTHTSAILKSGIKELISPKIKLISGPGCPVCVTPASYIDRLVELALTPGCEILSFGDMLKVPGSKSSLNGAKANGGTVHLIYSPLQALEFAKKSPGTQFVVAAVGFETTVPSYALLIDTIIKEKISNIKLLVAVKTVIPALEFICKNEKEIDAFICPGHVSVIIGSKAYAGLSKEYHKPFVISGFDGEQILAAIYEIVHQLKTGDTAVKNFYKSVVSGDGNENALEITNQYFTSYNALWRGVGIINGSGLRLKNEFSFLDAGRVQEEYDFGAENCSCSDIILGRLTPDECPLFGNACTPFSPVGPCMVSSEGSCGIHYRYSLKGEKI